MIRFRFEWQDEEALLHQSPTHGDEHVDVILQEIVEAVDGTVEQVGDRDGTLAGHDCRDPGVAVELDEAVSKTLAELV